MSHAILSPSAASRWLLCSRSARLEQQFPDRSGAAASEGTLAHSLGELLIAFKVKRILKRTYTEKLKEIKANPLFDDAMLDHMDEYATYVVEQYSKAQARTKDAVLFLEQKLDMTDYVPEGFGTGDVGIIADHTMDFIDLKYGKGVPVSCVNNKQMMLYALGALKAYDMLYDIEHVRMTIYQPRLDNISTFEISVADLKDWAENELKPRAELAFAGEGEFAPGEVCRFCKAAATCKANADFNLQLAKYEFQEAVLLSDDDVSDILTRADLFTKWLSAVEEHAQHEAVVNGKKWPGFKLVEGRSVRVYADETKVVETLVTKGLEENTLFTKKILGITAMEKLLGKSDFATYLSSLVVKPPGKPTLVPANDKRPEYNSAEGAAADFAEVINEELM
jgi:hypothetical protein